MTQHEASIFTAGQNAGSRVAAGVARLAAGQLLDDSHWWNRWRCRLLAGGLIAYAEEMEEVADLREPARVEQCLASPARRTDGHSGHAMPVGPSDGVTHRHVDSCTAAAPAR